MTMSNVIPRRRRIPWSQGSGHHSLSQLGLDNDISGFTKPAMVIFVYKIFSQCMTGLQNNI